MYYVERTCPHFGRDKRGDISGKIYGDYVCNLHRRDMRDNLDFVGRYCNGADFVIDDLRPYLQCPHFRH